MSNDTMNSSCASFTKEELTIQNAKLSSELDGLKQELHDTKRLLSNSKTMELHLLSELESSQNSDKTETHTLLKKISHLETELKSCKELYSENIQYLEKELEEKGKEIDRHTLKIKTELDNQIKMKRSEMNQYNDDIFELRTQMETLNNSLMEMEKKYDVAMEQNFILKQENNELQNNNEELRECLNVKKQQLEESDDLNNNLQDKVIVLKNEIEELRLTPINKKAKGNSLFAEVDDSREQLKKYTENLNQSYIEIKQKYNNKTLEFDKIRLQYAMLVKNLGNQRDNSEEQSKLENIYKKQVERLENKIKVLENEISLRTSVSDKALSHDMKCVEEMINISRNEVLSLHTELQSEASCRSFVEQTLCNIKSELRKSRMEVLKLRTENSELNSKLEEYNLSCHNKNEINNDKIVEKHQSPVKIEAQVQNKENTSLVWNDFENSSELSFEKVDRYVPFDYYPKPMLENHTSNILNRYTFTRECPVTYLKEVQEKNRKEEIPEIINTQIEDEYSEQSLKMQNKKKVCFVEVKEKNSERPIRRRNKVLTTPSLHIPSIIKEK